jgi:NAD(P)-dependent dehydrogenase (short-subunit alcohol dehydrogenase family)
MVTGATAGIGQVTALELARQGATVVLVGRYPQRCKTVVETIRMETSNASVDYLVADLSVMSQVRQLADEFTRRYSRLDVLVNNAGALFLRRRTTQEGLEMTFALNHLNYFLLTDLLLEILKASVPARIVNVSSDAHRGARLDFSDLQSQHGYRGYAAYGRSKLMNVLFTYELARQLAGVQVTANALHPGLVATRFAMNNGPIVSLGMRFVHLGALSPQAGARTSIYLASSPEVEGVTGQYFTRERAVKSDPASYDEAGARRLWEMSGDFTRS